MKSNDVRGKTGVRDQIRGALDRQAGGPDKRGVLIGRGRQIRHRVGDGFAAVRTGGDALGVGQRHAAPRLPVDAQGVVRIDQVRRLVNGQRRRSRPGGRRQTARPDKRRGKKNALKRFHSGLNGSGIQNSRRFSWRPLVTTGVLPLPMVCRSCPGPGFSRWPSNPPLPSAAPGVPRSVPSLSDLIP